MIDVARNVYTRDHVRCEKRRGRDVYVWTTRVFLNVKSSIELRKKCRGALTSSRFPHHQKRDEIIEKTPTFQGRQKMIKCLLSSLKDLALERDRTKERAIDVSFPPASSSFVLPRWDFRGEREIAGEKKNSIINNKAIGSLFFLFFSL